MERNVTVVIPHFGDPSPTVKLIESLLNGDSARLSTIVVSDDYSPTPFPQKRFPTSLVAVIRRTRNGGFGSAVNSGLAHVRTPLALIVNSDAQITGRQIDELVRLSAPWHPAIAAPRVVGHDGQTQWVPRTYPTVSSQVVEWLTPLARFRETSLWNRLVSHDVEAELACGPTRVEWVTGVVMLIPVEQVKAIGGFDESFFMNSEETDLQIRLREVGVPALFIPSVVVTHEGGGSSHPQKRRTWLVESRFHYARKHGNARSLRAALTCASGLNFAVNLVRQAAGRDTNAYQTLQHELELLRVASVGSRQDSASHE